MISTLSFSPYKADFRPFIPPSQIKGGGQEPSGASPCPPLISLSFVCHTSKCLMPLPGHSSIRSNKHACVCPSRNADTYPQTHHHHHHPGRKKKKKNNLLAFFNELQWTSSMVDYLLYLCSQITVLLNTSTASTLQFALGEYLHPDHIYTIDVLLELDTGLATWGRHQFFLVAT